MGMYLVCHSDNRSIPMSRSYFKGTNLNQLRYIIWTPLEGMMDVPRIQIDTLY